MDYLDLDSSDDVDEAGEQKHQYIVRARAHEIAMNDQKRRITKDNEEKNRFPKIKHADRSLMEYIGDEIASVPLDLQEWYNSFKSNVIQHFENGVEDFIVSMKRIEKADAFHDFLVNRHMNIASEPKTEEKENMHKGLFEFHKQIVTALRKMTSIPSDEKIISSAAQNVFEDTYERALKRIASEMSAEHVREQLQAAEDKEKMIRENKLHKLDKRLERLSISAPDLSREFKALTLNCNKEIRDTSPPRRDLSETAIAQLNEEFKSLFVKDPVTLDEDNDCDFFHLFSGSISDDEDSPEDCAYNDEVTHLESNFDQKPEWVEHVIICKKEEEEEELNLDEEEDFMEFDKYKAISDQLERTGSCFGQKPLEYKRNEWNLEQFRNRRKKQSKVKFEKYDSPQNKMRIFVKPNGNFFKSDDSSVTDYVDLSLRDGTLILKDVEFPLTTLASKASGFRSRRRNEQFDLKQQKVIKEPNLYLKGTYRGNLLGRFWCSRDTKDIQTHLNRCSAGVLNQYREQELLGLYQDSAERAQKCMRRGRSLIQPEVFNETRMNMANVHGVLLLTDWRLLFLRENVLTNALIQYMPTNLGNVFFETMTEYLTELILDANIEFHTIIFAFGGSPLFKKQDFIKFWKQLIIYTNKTIDVHWMAQDWLDGMVCSKEDIDQLTEFNQYVEKVFNSMRETGLRNYAFCNVRNQYKVPLLPVDAYKTPANNDCLQHLYFAYIRHFVNESNCYGFSTFFNNSAPSIDNYNDDDARYPKRKTPEESRDCE